MAASGRHARHESMPHTERWHGTWMSVHMAIPRVSQYHHRVRVVLGIGTLVPGWFHRFEGKWVVHAPGCGLCAFPCSALCLSPLRLSTSLPLSAPARCSHTSTENACDGCASLPSSTRPPKLWLAWRAKAVNAAAWSAGQSRSIGWAAAALYMAAEPATPLPLHALPLPLPLPLHAPPRHESAAAGDLLRSPVGASPPP